MTTTTTTKGCEGCGKARELNDQGYCAACERIQLECDGYTAEVLLGLLETTVEKVLEHCSPGDVFKAVHDALRRTGRDGAAPLSTLLIQTRDARDRAERELEAVAA
jgi:hypothetical protein